MLELAVHPLCRAWPERKQTLDLPYTNKGRRNPSRPLHSTNSCYFNAAS
jgi:hypothetical protein